MHVCVLCHWRRGAEGEGGGWTFKSVFEASLPCLWKKTQGHFLTQKDSACQISADSEQLEKSQRNRYIRLPSTEPINHYLVQSMTRWYYKVRQLCLLQSATSVITKCDRYYKVWQVLLQSATGITKCDGTLSHIFSTSGGTGLQTHAGKFTSSLSPLPSSNVGNGVKYTAFTFQGSKSYTVSRWRERGCRFTHWFVNIFLLEETQAGTFLHTKIVDMADFSIFWAIWKIVTKSIQYLPCMENFNCYNTVLLLLFTWVNCPGPWGQKFLCSLDGKKAAGERSPWRYTYQWEFFGLAGN